MRHPFTILAEPVPAARSSGGSRAAWQSPAIDALSPLSEAVAEDAPRRYREALERVGERADEVFALSIHLPFCAAHCLCCDRPIHAAQSPGVIGGYVDDLCDEIESVASHLGSAREVAQLHLGGGSATELDPSQLVRLIDRVQRQWRVPADADLAAECDPRRVGEAQLTLLRGLGFRRVTFGVLDLDAGVQAAIGRRQSEALVDDVCELARSCGIESVNLDLMVGLPRQTLPGWRDTLSRVIAMAPDRVTLARYRHRPGWAAVQQLIDVDDLPDAATVAALSEVTAAMLRDAGYRWIGADHFVLEGDELSSALDGGRLRRNLVGYTGAPAGPVIGLGAGAVSDIDGTLYWNEPLMPAWREGLQDGALPIAFAQPATETERHRRRAIEQLLCALELPAAQVRGGLEAAYAQLARHEKSGLVRTLDDRIVVTDRGRSVLHRLCAEFGAAIGAPAPYPA